MKLRRNSPGGSYIVTLPRDFVLSLQWKEGDRLKVTQEGRKIVVTKVDIIGGPGIDESKKGEGENSEEE